MRYKIPLLLSIFLIASFLRFYNLNSKPPFFPDEYIYYNTARYYAFGIENPIYSQFSAGTINLGLPNHVNYEHPLLGKLVIAFSLIIFGDQILSARIMLALIGIASVLLVYLIAKKLFSEEYALALSFLYAIDPLNVSLSRSAMLDGISLLFFLLALFSYLHFNREEHKLLGFSFFSALSFSTKYTSFPLLISTILFALNLKRRFLATVLSIFIFSVVYLISYLPYFLWFGNYTSILPKDYYYLDYGPHSISDFINLQFWILEYNFSWHLGKNYYDFLIFNPFLYVIIHNGHYQIFTSNPLIIYSGIALLLISFLEIRNQNLLYIFLPQSTLFILRGFSWYLTIYNFLSLLIIFYVFSSKKSNLYMEDLFIIFLFAIFLIDIVILYYYFFLP